MATTSPQICTQSQATPASPSPWLPPQIVWPAVRVPRSPGKVTRVLRWWKRNCVSRPACHNTGGHARIDQGVVGVMRELS